MRMPGSLPSATVAKDGWIRDSAPQMYAMTGPKLTGPASVGPYSVPNPCVAMWWTHPTNWSRSSRRPVIGRSHRRIAVPATSATRTIRMSARLQPADGVSDAARPPVPLGGARDVAEHAQRRAVGAHGICHLTRPVEQALDLAFVDRDAGDLLLDLVGDVGEGCEQAHAPGQIGEGIGSELIQALEVAPQRIGEVLVEHDLARVFRSWHHPPVAEPEELDAGLAAQLVIDVSADAQRQVDLLRLEAVDLTF